MAQLQGEDLPSVCAVAGRYGSWLRATAASAAEWAVETDDDDADATASQVGTAFDVSGGGGGFFCER